ncbi:hypothetical protein C4D60_Mb04t17860 [Musa balbisiana]|uniref:Non-specific lipid-transfer protein n=1 Tax=Musa balbisiana TaxID=52838 RepID=A0A4S8KCS2_MUSBA|nr:hypothetical protein C4D60_Mb04t17860 [Musa balbisiana]
MAARRFVYRDVIPCPGCLLGGPITHRCCSGIKSLVAAARTTHDRRTACGCIETATAVLSGIDFVRVGQLPGRCGVSLPYKISPNVDCKSKEQGLLYVSDLWAQGLLYICTHNDTERPSVGPAIHEADTR